MSSRKLNVEEFEEIVEDMRKELNAGLSFFSPRKQSKAKDLCLTGDLIWSLVSSLLCAIGFRGT